MRMEILTTRSSMANLSSGMHGSLSDRKEGASLNRFTSIVGLLLAISINACSSPPPRAASGKKLKMETITHDWQTTYVFREVDDSPAASAKH
jgi:hypothetical protein